MSEANSPKEQEQPVPQQSAEPTVAARAAKPASKGSALAAVALLIAAVGVAAGGWSVWQLRALQSGAQQQAGSLEKTSSQTAALSQRTDALDRQLQQLPTVQELEERRRLVAQLQGDQQLLNQRLETVLGASRQDWRLAEAEHLLRLASLRLSALQDIKSATALVQGADEILRDQDDPAAYAAREQLAKSLEALRATDNPDRTGLFLQLGALREQAAQLDALNPKFVADGGVLGEMAAESEPGTWWGHGLQTLSNYFRLDFNADQNVRPLLAGQSLTQVRLALSLALEQAQWAALHGYSSVYRQALQQAADVLDANFNRDNPDSRALRTRVGELVDQPIEVEVPQLAQSLTAVQAYIEQKQSARERLKEAPGAEEARP